MKRNTILRGVYLGTESSEVKAVETAILESGFFHSETIGSDLSLKDEAFDQVLLFLDFY